MTNGATFKILFTPDLIAVLGLLALEEQLGEVELETLKKLYECVKRPVR